MRLLEADEEAAARAAHLAFFSGLCRFSEFDTAATDAASRLASLHELDLETGGSFVVPGGFGQMRGSPEIASVSGVARDVALAQRLWDVTATLTGIDSIER